MYSPIIQYVNETSKNKKNLSTNTTFDSNFQNFNFFQEPRPYSNYFLTNCLHFESYTVETTIKSSFIAVRGKLSVSGENSYKT